MRLISVNSEPESAFCVKSLFLQMITNSNTTTTSPQTNAAASAADSNAVLFILDEKAHEVNLAEKIKD